ncbi:MAG: uracil-DNA glycosylase family protein [Nitrososphaeraceae archaeon]
MTLYLTAAARCAPPQNKASPSEISNCSQPLLAEIRILERTIKVIVVLGKIAFDAYCRISNIKELKCGHNRIYTIHGDKTLIISYHPSRRNTNIHTLTWQMWISIFETARSIITQEKKNANPKNLVKS